MVLRGVLEKSFGSFLCLRGFAPMEELAHCSYPDTANYQRDKDEKHVDEIREFISNDIENLFYPEVILGVSLEELGASVEEQEWLFGEALEKGGSRHKLGQCAHISVFSKKFTDPDGTVSTYNTGSFYGLESQRLVYRIDGNHRLEAAEEGISDDIKQRKIPFCLIIFGGKDVCRRKSATIFSNINFKALPLSREANIRSVVNNTDISDDELIKDSAFGVGYLFCRKLVGRRCDNKLFAKYLGVEEPHTILQELGELVAGMDADEKIVEKCEMSYRALDGWLKDIEGEKLYKFSAYSGVVRIAMAYYWCLDQKACIEQDAKVASEHAGVLMVCDFCTHYVRFLKWIEDNHLESLSGIAAKDLVRLFDKVYDQMPKKMFLARWYPESGDEKRKSDARYAALEKVAKDENLELIDMEHQMRGAFSIRNAIDISIPDADLFVADLTGLRPNVMVEIGMALHHLPKNRVLFYMQKAEEVPGMVGPVEKPPFDLSGYSYDKIVDSSEIDTLIRQRIRGILGTAHSHPKTTDNQGAGVA